MTAVAGCASSVQPPASDADADGGSAPWADAATTETATVPANCAFNGLEGYLPFDGDTLDHSGYRVRTGAAHIEMVDGKIGQAARFDGTDSFVDFISGPVLEARTLCAWVRLRDRDGPGEPIFTGGVGIRGDFLAAFTSTPPMGCDAGAPHTLFVSHVNTLCASDPTATVSTGDWSFVCYGFDGADHVVLSVNGRDVTVPGSMYTYAVSDVVIGSNDLGTAAPSASLNGDVDEVTVWSRLLSVDEVAALWNHGAGCSPRAH